MQQGDLAELNPSPAEEGKERKEIPNDRHHHAAAAARRALAEEDSREGAPGAVAAAAGSEGASLYQPGAFSSSGAANLGVYLTKKVGLFCLGSL